MNVGPTPFYLRIYDETTQAYVITCGTGTTCTTPVTEPTPTADYYVAVISDPSASYPPGGVQADSAIAAVVWQGVGISLSASPTTVAVGSPATLTATTSTDIGPSPFYTEIYDAISQTWLRTCGSGTTCSVTVSQGAATTHQYIAYESGDSAAYPPAGLQEASLPSFVTWSGLGWQVSLSAPPLPSASRRSPPPPAATSGPRRTTSRSSI
jgi:hypothetical protein